MSSISTHVLDISLGRPAAGVPVVLEIESGDDWSSVGEGVTDEDGRVGDLLGGRPLTAATYRLTFDTDSYFANGGRQSFYTRVQVAFTVRAVDEHHHVPLLLSPFGYSTYRGS